MLIIGVTGRSGSGKSTVTKHYAALGHPTMDGDAVSREVTGPGSACLEELVAAFGEEILNPDGTLHRKKLGQIAFSDPEKTKLLNNITHPHIHNETVRRQDEARAAGAPLFFVDGAAIIGGPYQARCDRIVLVVADQRLSISRIILRDGISKTAAAHRLSAQKPVEELIAASDYVIENNTSEEALLQKADAVLEKLLREAEEAEQR
ncbi:MAG: dephospho-CoA kinase [Ruminococcaceae bacterium]|nr:dephospho-CoA kinase [Oscillospiraceae bacterium]